MLLISSILSEPTKTGTQRMRWMSNVARWKYFILHTQWRASCIIIFIQMHRKYLSPSLLLLGGEPVCWHTQCWSPTKHVTTLNLTQSRNWKKWSSCLISNNIDQVITLQHSFSEPSSWYRHRLVTFAHHNLPTRSTFNKPAEGNTLSGWKLVVRHISTFQWLVSLNFIISHGQMLQTGLVHRIMVMISTDQIAGVELVPII